MRRKLAALLLDAQNPDGGWAAGRTGVSNAEASAFCLSALAPLRAPGTDESIERGTSWLSAQQDPNGGFSFAGGLAPSAWVTALSLLALMRLDAIPQRTLRAAQWLVVNEGRGLGWLTWLAFHLMPEDRRLRLNSDLKGWSWHPESFSWVEPTALALIALKKLRPQLDASRVDERIRQGELLLYDRMCRGGGWNYGNSTVLGEDLPPFPNVTALALVALQDRASEAAVQRSLEALDGMLAGHASGLTLSWSILCFLLHGRDVGGLRERLVRRYDETGLLGETRSIALALIALQGATQWLRV
jgi:hypothetical protein